MEKIIGPRSMDTLNEIYEKTALLMALYFYILP